MLFALWSLVFGPPPSVAALTRWKFVLGLNFGLIIALAASLALHIARIGSRTDDDTAAPQMHLRFAGLLSLGAVIPAVIVAAFLGAVFVRTINSWFSDSIGASVDGIANVARTAQQNALRDVRQTMLAVAGDLNNPDAAEGMRSQPVTYTAYLEQQAIYAGAEALYVINRRGSVLASSQRSAGQIYTKPLEEEFVQAEAFASGTAEEPPVWINRQDGRLRAIAHLNAYPNAYLYFATPFDPAIFESLLTAERAFAQFEQTAARKTTLQTFLIIVYAEMTLLVVLGAAWAGMRIASRLVRPIGDLVRASEHVGRGDLTARVPLDAAESDMVRLARTFNQMTEQLSSQRDDLIAATAIAEARREVTEAVLAGVSAGVLGIEPTGEISLANASALELLGARDATSLIGQRADAAAPEFAAVIAEAKRTGEAAEANIDLSREGIISNLRVRAASSDDQHGAVVVTFDDVTRLISAQRSAAWRDVARRIAHEIKNPLTPIQLSAERLRRKYTRQITSDTEIFERCITTVLNQVHDIRRMVDEFSAFARMPAPRLASTNLVNLVRETVFAQRVAAPSIEFPVTANDAALSAVCDERLVGQALTNVLKNAVEALSGSLEQGAVEKSKPARIETVMSVEHQRVVMTITDNGPGWPGEHKERLLEPYTTTREKGTGLGLAIVKRIMEDHDGRLELADRVDGKQGAVVRLVLPLTADQDENEDADVDTHSQHQQHPQPQATLTTRTAHGT